MSLARLFAKRIGLGFLAAWGVLTAVFAMFALTRNWVLQAQVGKLRWVGSEEEVIEAAREQYFASRGLDEPLFQRYLDWLIDMLTLNWRTSFVTGDPVMSIVVDAAARTAMYVLPAVVLAIAAGILLGVYAAMNPDGYLANTGRGLSYLLFAVPGFWLGRLLVSMQFGGVIGEYPLVFDHLLPILFTAMTLLGGYVSYARAHSLEYAGSDFVKLVEAKGAGPVRIARHVLRNAAIPLFSMLFTEALALLVLTVFVVETVFGIDGFGLVLIDAVDQRDIPVLLGGTMVIIAVGVGGNILQDVSYSVLDPRVDTGSRS